MVCGRISSILCLLFLIFGLFFTDVLLNAQTTDRTNTQSGEILDPLSIPRSVIGSGLVRQVKFSPKGDEIAVTTTLGVEILNASNLSPLAFYSLKPGVSNAISYSTDGQKIAVVAGLETFVINRRTNQIIQLKKAKQVQGVAFAPDDRLFTLLSDGIVQVWDSQQDLADFATAEPTKWHQHRYRPRAISFSPSGSYVATGAADRVISIRRLSDGQWMGNLSGAGLVNQIAFSMDESQLVASSLEGVRARSAKTMQRTKKLHTKRTGSDYHLATDLNSSRFAIVSRTSGNCAIWDLMLEKKETEFQADIGTISATFHPQGKNFVTATPYSIKIWNPEMKSYLKEAKFRKLNCNVTNLNKVKKINVITGKGMRSKNINDPYQSSELSILKYSVPEYIKNNSELMKKIIKIDFESVDSPSKGNFDIILKSIK